MSRQGKLSHLTRLEKKIQTVRSMTERENRAIEEASRLGDELDKEAKSTREYADRICIFASKVIDEVSKNDVPPEKLEKDLAELRSTYSNLNTHNQQLKVQVEEGIQKEENLNRLIKERVEVKDFLKSEVEEKTSLYNVVYEKLNKLQSYDSQMHGLYNKFIATAQHFKELN
uniref:Flagellar FliJ protein n=1 Tax=Strongyloides papillosus TaxID=174720 RepID=A0A0N5BV92_STREA